MPHSNPTTGRDEALRELSTCIRHERDTSGWSQLAVATQAGVSQQFYAGIEAGQRPLAAHRAPEFGDSVVLGVIRWLLGQLKETRYELVRASDERLCAASMTTLAALVRKSSQVCASMATALEDGKLTDAELDQVDKDLGELEETVRQTRRDVAVKKELRRRERRETQTLAKCSTGSIALSKRVG